MDALLNANRVQALKKYTSGGTGSGGSQTQLVSMAMAEASKLFDKSGGASSGGKQDAVNGAAMTVVKLLVQSKFSGGITGGNSGSLGSLMSLVSVDRSRFVVLMLCDGCLGLQVCVTDCWPRVMVKGS